MKYAVAVADAGSFARAATDLVMAQSTVSQQVARLERELGAKLFDRSRRNIRLTAAGRLFLPAGRALLDAEQEVRESVVATRRAVRMTFPTGFRTHAASLREVWDEMMAGQPTEGAALTQIDSGGDDPADLVADGTIDAAIVHGTVDRAGVTSHRLADDPLVILVAGASGAQLSGLASLADRPLLLHVSARGSALVEVLVRESRRAGHDPRIDYFTHHAGPFAALAEQDRGWSALYARQASVFDLTTLGVAVVETEAAIGVPTTLLTRPEDDRLASLLLAALDGTIQPGFPVQKDLSR